MEQGISTEREYDEFEESAEHIVVYNGNNEPVAAGRWRAVDDAAKLERICVLPSERKHGLGKAVVKAMEEMAREKGLVKAKLHGQAYARQFYEKLGYSAASDVFMEEGIPHLLMVKELTK